MNDIIIIGAGIVGCQLAYDLSRFDLKVLVLEKNREILNEVSSANSGIIHPGYDPKEGTLKAKLNLRGAQRYPELCQQLHVDYQQVGSLLCTTSEEEFLSLKDLEDRALLRDIPVERLTRSEILSMEPHIADGVESALYFPTTAILMPWEMGYALMDTACLNGVVLHRHEPCISVIRHEDHFEVITSKGRHQARCVINASGLNGDAVARMIDPNIPNRISYRKGQYHVSDRLDEDYIRHVLFPVPSSKGKGILAVKTTEGNLLFGPTSEPVEDGHDFGTDAHGLSEIETKISQLIKPLPKSTMIRQFTGMRPVPNTKDFIIESPLTGWINVIGIESPGLASSPGISEYVIETFVERWFDLKSKETLIPAIPPVLHRLEGHEAWHQRIQSNPLYGHVVCVCEQVSEQEVLDAIRKPAGALTVKGVKRRVRPGSGRCQGGFCENKIVALLAQELKISISEVCYDDTPFLMEVEDA